MYQCKFCPATFPSQYLLDQHQLSHRGMPGFYENQQPTTTDKGVELKALEHQLNALRQKQQKTPVLTSPIPPPKPQEQVHIPAGWVSIGNGAYKYEHELFRHITPISSTIAVLNSTVNRTYGKCLLHTYDKDLSEVVRMQEKEAILEARLASLVPSDKAFPQVAMELNKVKNGITCFTKNQRPDEVHHLVFESYNKNPQDSNETAKWQSEFMARTLTESDRLKNNFVRQHETDNK